MRALLIVGASSRSIVCACRCERFHVHVQSRWSRCNALSKRRPRVEIFYKGCQVIPVRRTELAQTSPSLLHRTPYELAILDKQSGHNTTLRRRRTFGHHIEQIMFGKQLFFKRPWTAVDGSSHVEIEKSGALIRQYI